MEIIYRCPVCKLKLEQLKRSFICKQNHTYDIAREGYVNFLLANQKKTKDPGDNKFMTDNRKYFLDQGYYNPLADEIKKIIEKSLREDEIRKQRSIHILDAGCGVGTYADKLKKTLKNKSSDHLIQLWGVDISKSAIQKASKTCPGIQFCIGSNFELPYLDTSIDMIISIFSPLNPRELFRVLKPGGKILLIRPGSNHLKGIGALIYNQFQLQGNEVNLSEGLGYDMVFKKKHHLQYEIHLKKNADIMSLIAMTPYFWHLNADQKKQLADIHEVTTTVDFCLSLFQKVSSS